MEESFFINIDCSKILHNKEGTQYTMQIDGTKMTIVFELVEWIRWIFSVDDCFYLSHNNLVIHELEDITVLSKLKTFEIKLCGQFQCIHKKIYRQLLSNIKFFVHWGNIRVPRYFAEKITHIEQKIFQQNQLFSNCEDTDLKSYLAQNPETPKTKNSKRDDFSGLKKVVDSYTNCKEIYINDTQKSASTNNLNEMTKSYQKEVTCATPDRTRERINKNLELSTKQNEEIDLEKINSIDVNKLKSYYSEDLENSVSVKSLSLSQENNNSYLNNTLRLNLTEDNTKLKDNSKLKKASSFNKIKKHIKPFSIGEFVTNIREKSNKENYTEEENTFSDIQGFVNSDFKEDEILTVEKRKRKRKRTRSRGNKKVSIMQEFSKASSLENEKMICAVNLKNCFTEIKPNHIRFNIDDDDDDNVDVDVDVDIVDNKNSIKAACQQKNKSPNSCNISVESDNSKMLTVNSEEVTALDTNKQLLSTMNRESPASKYVPENSELLITNDQVKSEENLNFLDQIFLTPAAGSDNLDSNTQNLNTLMLLKEKFPSPVVVERFY